MLATVLVVMLVVCCLITGSAVFVLVAVLVDSWFCDGCFLVVPLLCWLLCWLGAGCCAGCCAGRFRWCWLLCWLGSGFVLVVVLVVCWLILCGAVFVLVDCWLGDG